MAQRVKNLATRKENWFWSLGQENPLEKGMAIHSSILAGRIPWTEEPGGLQSMGEQRVRHNWVINTFTFSLHMQLLNWQIATELLNKLLKKNSYWTSQSPSIRGWKWLSAYEKDSNKYSLSFSKAMLTLHHNIVQRHLDHLIFHRILLWFNINEIFLAGLSEQEEATILDALARHVHTNKR